MNEHQLKSALRIPTFELVDSTEHLGRWTLATRTIALARSLVHKQAWGVVVEVLRHEMAHQYAHEVLRATDETAHGPAFRMICKRLGIDAASAGLPAPSEADARIHRRVEKLLALAGSDNRNEAEAAMTEARRLLLVHNLDLTPSTYTWRHLGKPTGRVAAWWRQLASLLNEHFFVETLWTQVFVVGVDEWKAVLEICGTPGNVEMAAWVHDWLVDTAERLWLNEKDALALQGASDHARYLGGVVKGFAARLQEGAKRSQQEGLVWVGDPGAADFLADRYGRLRTVRYSVRGEDYASQAGFAQGKGLVLHRPVQGGSESGGRMIGMKGS